MMTYQTDFSGYTILIVDDNPTNLGVIADYLDEYKFEIITARRGEEGLDRANYADPDLILLDVMMPGIDGFETCRQLKASEVTKHIPVIFMTALASEDDKVKGFDAGAVDYVTKPVQQREVLARIHTHLRIQAQAKQLKAQAEQLTSLNASKDKFFSIVAHDLRGPFMPMLGNAELMYEMAEDLPRPTIKEMSQDIYTSGQRVLGLLENLLQWSRIQMGHMNYEPESFDIHEIAARNMDLLHTSAKEKEITLHNDIPSGTRVFADVNMLDTIIRNLTNNAIKFTRMQGHIHVSAKPNGSFVEIAVQDDGIGIEPENLGKLLQVGVHYSTSGTSKEKGTGLGLIMCKEMIEMNGGQIWIESEVDKGTTIHFSVPTKTIESD